MGNFSPQRMVQKLGDRIRQFQMVRKQSAQEAVIEGNQADPISESPEAAKQNAESVRPMNPGSSGESKG